MNRIVKASLVLATLVLIPGVNSWAADAASPEAVDACNKEAVEAGISSDETGAFVNTCLEDAGYAPVDTKSQSKEADQSEKG